MESNISKKILAGFTAIIFLSAVLLIFVQNILILLSSIIIILCIIIGMVIGLDHIRKTNIIQVPEGRKGADRLERIFNGTRDLPVARSSKHVTTLLCPNCGGKELYYEAGLITGYKYHCKDCDYIGAFIIEKDFKV